MSPGIPPIAAAAAAVLAGVAAEARAGSDPPAPVVHERWVEVEGSLPVGSPPVRVFPLSERGHTLILPAEGEARGLIVLFGRGRVDAAATPGPGGLQGEALARGVGLLHVATGNPLEFFRDDDVMRAVAGRIDAVLTEHDLAGTPLLFAGHSLGGTRALRMAIFLARNPGEFGCAPAAAAVADAPLDMARFWRAEHRASRDEIHAEAKAEGTWVSRLLEQTLGGTPEEAADAYADYSPFSYEAEDGGNARFLADLPLRAYHRPDVDWWVERLGKSYYYMNSIDLAGMVAALRTRGGDRAELVTVPPDPAGYGEGASPHAWENVVDDGELVEWFLAAVGGGDR